jgi:hypothetical protein
LTQERTSIGRLATNAIAAIEALLRAVLTASISPKEERKSAVLTALRTQAEGEAKERSVDGAVHAGAKAEKASLTDAHLDAATTANQKRVANSSQTA